ncbi:MAG TPA: hypothetical protein VHU14_00940 [Solirubrobacterales bacterium]|jgi:hypothetical protein|nr:hypothetical protein [Solirubrobacterales bacterium]
MKIKLSRRSTVVVVAAIGMLVLSGSALARSGPTATSSAHHGKIKYRFGKIVDTDTTANDGQFNYAHGHANCKHNERLISGGLRWNHGSITAIVGHFQTVASGPVKREWTVTAASDMGGAARADFVVVATCEIR